MRLSTNVIVQVIGLVLQLANQYGSAVPPKYQFWVAGIVGIAQGLSAIVSHFSNPDGSSSTMPYTPGK